MKVTTMKAMFVIAALALLLCSCASATENLQRATAEEAGNTLTRDVTIYNVNRGATSVSWQAKTPSGCFDCDSDDMVRRVHCVKVDCSKIDTTKPEQ
jgi:PBP1b-binding outer membrane lipoprotein LpoB